MSFKLKSKASKKKNKNGTIGRCTNRVSMDLETSYDRVLEVYKTYDNDGNETTESILDLFKPEEVLEDINGVTHEGCVLICGALYKVSPLHAKKALAIMNQGVDVLASLMEQYDEEDIENAIVGSIHGNRDILRAMSKDVFDFIVQHDTLHLMHTTAWNLYTNLVMDTLFYAPIMRKGAYSDALYWSTRIDTMQWRQTKNEDEQEYLTGQYMRAIYHLHRTCRLTLLVAPNCIMESTRKYLIKLIYSMVGELVAFGKKENAYEDTEEKTALDIDDTEYIIPDELPRVDAQGNEILYYKDEETGKWTEVRDDDFDPEEIRKAGERYEAFFKTVAECVSTMNGMTVFGGERGIGSKLEEMIHKKDDATIRVTVLLPDEDETNVPHFNMDVDGYFGLYEVTIPIGGTYSVQAGDDDEIRIESIECEEEEDLRDGKSKKYIAKPIGTFA